MRTRDHFGLLAERLEDASLFLLRADGTILTWNGGAARVQGYTPDEVVGRDWAMLYADEARAAGEPDRHLEIALSSGRFHGTVLRRRADGTLFSADVLLVAFVVDGRCDVLCELAHDLSAAQQLQREHDLATATARRLEEESVFRSRFIATLTHDLRSPLTAALLAAELLLAAPGSDEQARGWARHISSALARLQRMITDLLDVESVDAGGQLALTMAACDLRAVVDDVVGEMARRHGERFVVVVAEGAGPLWGSWHEQSLRRVVEHLLDNAVKYGGAAPIVVTLGRARERAVLAVRNEGPVIPPDVVPHLFTPFHCTQTAGRGGKRGWGLGLALVRGLVVAHHGEVRCTSDGAGTIFTVELPVAAAIEEWRPSG